MAKILIAYFSHAGQNYSHGGIKNLKVGNTEVVAKKLHAMIPSDLFYIDTISVNYRQDTDNPIGLPIGFAYIQWLINSQCI